MNVRGWWAAVAMAACVGGCARSDEGVAITPEPSPAPTAVSPETPPVVKPAFVLAGEDTRLHAAADEASPSFSPKEKGAGAVVVLEVAPDQPEAAEWVRLRATERRSICGYEPLSLAAPVHARRSELLSTLRSTKIIESPGAKTRLELRPGVAVHPTRTEGTYLVMTPEARAKIAIDRAEVTTELPVESLERVQSKPDEAAAAPAPVSIFGGSDGPLAVGEVAVHLSRKKPPKLSAVEGDDSLSRLETPCLTVVGKRPPDPLAALWGDSIGDSFGGKGLGLSGIGEGMGSSSEPSGFGMGGLGHRGVGGTGLVGDGYGTLGHGAGTGQGYGTGSGRLGRARPAPPRIRLGSASVKGSRPPEIVERLVRRRLGRLRLCYEGGVQRDSSLSGRVLVSFAVRADGAVTTVKSVPSSEAEPEGTTLSDERVVACVAREISALVFPKGEGMVVVRLPLTFSPGE